jgi:putative ABC transport system substrate-binding protein
MPTDVLVVNSTPLLAIVKELTRTIPIVFTQVADPISSGFVENYARPYGNITGFTDFDASMAGKWLEMLKDAAPGVDRVTVLSDPKQMNHQAFRRAIESAGASLKIEVSVAAVSAEPDLEQGITALRGQSDRGLVVLPGPVNNLLRDSIIQLAAKYRLPAVYPFRYYVRDGGLIYYGVDQVDQWPKAATYVSRILRGEKLSELPVEAPTKFELIVNLRAAKALGLTISPTFLATADEVIE